MDRMAQVVGERQQPRLPFVDAQRFERDHQRLRWRQVLEHRAFVGARLLAQRQHEAFVHGGGALAAGIERADRLERAVEELEAHGAVSAHREQVDDVAAHAAFARCQHQRH